MNHPGYPPNLFVEEEPMYEVVLVFRDGTISRLKVGERTMWKRVTAISYARYFARRYPQVQVKVTLLR